MRYRKVLLVSPPSMSRYGGLRLPASLGYIAQALYDNEIDYQHVDMRIGYSFKYLKRKIVDFKPELIGISMITVGYKKTYQIINNIKELFPHIKIVIGGHHVTILKEKVLEECKSIDYGVIFDGEETIIELCEDKIPISDIIGLIFRRGDKIISNGQRPIVMDLDKYNFPRYHNFRLKDYSRQLTIHSSRGCPYQCIFCPNKLLGRKHRTKSVNHFVDEIEYWYKRGYYQFAIDDDNFTLDKNRVYDICDEIERRNFNNIFIRCSNGIRCDRVDRQLLSRMKQIGVREIGFGVDGGNNKVLANLKKGETIEVIDEAIKNACELGFDVKIFIIIGTPHESISDVEDSLRLVKKYPVARAQLNNPIPYPGTELFDYVKEHNLFLIPPEIYLNEVSEEMSRRKSCYPIFETPELPKKERIKILKKCYKLENWVMRNTAARMYKDHTILSFFIKYTFNVRLFEKLFFNNLFLRKIFEKIRYKKLLARQSN